MSSLIKPDYSLILSEIVMFSIDYLKRTSPIWKYSYYILPNKNKALLYYLYY